MIFFLSFINSIKLHQFSIILSLSLLFSLSLSLSISINLSLYLSLSLSSLSSSLSLSPSIYIYLSLSHILTSSPFSLCLPGDSVVARALLEVDTEDSKNNIKELSFPAVKDPAVTRERKAKYGEGRGGTSVSISMNLILMIL